MTMTLSDRAVRPAPQDLAERFAEIGTLRGTARHYGADRKLVLRWLVAAGLEWNTRRDALQPAPDDFRQYAAQLGKGELMRRYGIGQTLLNRWLAEAGIEPPRRYTLPPERCRPVPDDFVAMARRLTIPALERHYRTSRKTVAKWLAATGVSPATSRHDPSQFRLARSPSVPAVQRLNNDGPEEAAAFVLRRFSPVYRCGEDGAANHKGRFWRIGNTVLTGDELIARAEKRAA